MVMDVFECYFYMGLILLVCVGILKKVMSSFKDSFLSKIKLKFKCYWLF